MNTQRKMLLEVLALIAVIGGIWLLIWNINFYPAKPVKSADENKRSALPITGDEGLEEGRLLFRSYCNSCHYVNANSLGPPLAGAKARWANAGSYQGKTGDQWMKTWIRNWKDATGAGYPYAVMMAKSRENEMNYFTNLTDRQIDLILRYVDSSSATK